MKTKFVIALTAALTLVLGGLAGVGSASAAPARPAAAPGTTAVGAAAPSGGQGRASAPRAGNMRTSAAQAAPKAAPRSFGTLGRDGRPTADALAGRAATAAAATKTAPAAPRVKARGPNAGTSSARSGGQTAPRPLIPTNTVNSNFLGINQNNSNCGCQPPDVNAAVGLNEIVQTVNLRLQVYSKTGTALCGIPLSNWFAGTLSDPRVQFDNAFNRYSMVLIPVPGAGATPTLYLATSQTSNPCGGWWLYSITFSGPLYPAGTVLDYPYLGQDRDSASPALLLSSNNFCCAPGFATYVGSGAFWIPKSAAYSGAGFSFTSFNVAFSSAPTTTSGVPMAVTTASYYLASVPGSGYALYRKSGGTLVLQANISSAFNAPSRAVTQGAGLPTLDPLDGRVDWSPYLSQGFIWFAHGIDLSGFPAVRYGAISTAANTATVATAFHSGTSDDFNPSIGVADAGTNVVRIWVNWAYTDVPAGRPQTSDTLNGVAPGGGVPSLIATDLTLRIGTTTNTNFRFGDYSSVSVDPVGGGTTAVVAQEHFQGGNIWSTNIASVTFSP
ncbi:MAG TPA: hypothetical protein VF069_18605 [Streptosporangiaceae bacterium]